MGPGRSHPFRMGRSAMRNVWGIHNDTLTSELVDEGFASIGWDDVGDLRKVPGG